jgi:CRP-like cAMP-binding protein
VAQPPLELLQRVPIFSTMERNDLERLARSFKERTFGEGDTVAAEGKGGVGFFVISDGQAGVSVQGEERATLGPGDYFGEIALIDEGARSATITAKSELHCFGLTPWDFRPLVETHAEIAWKLLQAMAKKLRAAEQHES